MLTQLLFMKLTLNKVTTPTKFKLDLIHTILKYGPAFAVKKPKCSMIMENILEGDHVTLFRAVMQSISDELIWNSQQHSVLNSFVLFNLLKWYYRVLYLFL